MSAGRLVIRLLLPGSKKPALLWPALPWPFKRFCGSHCRGSYWPTVDNPVLACGWYLACILASVLASSLPAFGMHFDQPVASMYSSLEQSLCPLTHRWRSARVGASKKIAPLIPVTSKCRSSLGMVSSALARLIDPRHACAAQGRCALARPEEALV